LNCEAGFKGFRAKHVPDMKILVINPNTTESMTVAIAAAAKAVAAPGTQVHAVTSAIGPASIEGFYDEAFAVPGVIAALRDAPDIDAAVIACFDDTGLDAARSATACPVVGICEAALIVAGQLSKRIGVVTTLSRSIVPLEELVRKYGYAERARVYACDVAVLDIERPGSNARAKIESEIVRALANGAESIVLGCAGMTRLTAELSSTFGVPVVDGVTAAVKQAEALVALGLATSRRGAYAAPLEKAYGGPLAGFAPHAARHSDRR
jgi:allantoin racemase